MATESSEGEEEGKITGGNKLLVIEDDLREMGKKAAWSVSSCKPGNGVSSLRDDNLDTYWQSDGAQPHLVNIQFQKKVKLQLVVLYVDFKLDESYTPSKISIRAGDGFHNLKEIKTMELVKPTGWVYLSLSGNDPRETFVNTFMLQIAVLSNHLNGRDTHATSSLEMLDFNHFSGIEEQVETELEFAPNIWQLKFSLFPNFGNPNGT
ncbi:hypothetical protein D5086_014608 [Populus alba]|uniref:Uncharacterized protein n=1 Tax=Populus alba TaxID=43335 RepID=A0ACC4BYJ7_POPAL